MSEANASKPIPPLYDDLWRYKGYHDCPSVCRLRLYDRGNACPYIAIFTELDDNTGTSVTNRIEVLATMVWRYLERPERGVTVIEHYPNRGMHNPIKNRWQFPEEFDLVEMNRTTDEQFERPRWRRVSRQTVEEMIGQNIED